MADKPRGTKARNQKVNNHPRVNARSKETPKSRQKPKKTGLVPSIQRKMKAFGRTMKKSPQLPIVLGAMVLCIILSVTVYAFTNKNAYSVLVNNEQICIIKKDKKVDNNELAEMAVEMIEIDLGTKIQVNETIDFKLVHANKKSMLSPDSAITKIASSLTYQVEAVLIKVDGIEMAILKNDAEVQQVKDKIIEPFLPEDSSVIANTGFLEDYIEQKVFVNKDEINTVDQAYGLLTATSKASETYTVVSGDTLSVISAKSNMSVDDILKLNPGHSYNSILRIGEELLLSVDKALLSVVTYEEITYTEIIPKGTVTQENASQPKSYTRAIQYGSDGQSEITAYRVRVNGIEEPGMLQIINERVVVEPVDEIIEVGTL